MKRLSVPMEPATRAKLKLAAKLGRRSMGQHASLLLEKGLEAEEPAPALKSQRVKEPK